MDLSNLIFYLKCYTGHGHQKTNAREQHSLGKWIMSRRKQININLILYASKQIFKTMDIIYYTNNEDKLIICKNGYERRKSV